MNEIAIIEQLPVITEKIKDVGNEVDKRLNELKLDSLVCNEDTRKEIKNLKIQLGAEFKVYETQRKEIKTKINEPYELFNKTYEKEIKSKYQEADKILKDKIDEVEKGIKSKAKDLAIEYFNEYKASKSVIKDSYLTFEEVNLQIGLDALTNNGALVKKYKDAIVEKIDNVEKELETISTMQNSEEIVVEYLKHKNLSIAIKEVNDRHLVLEQVKRQQELLNQSKFQEEKTIEIVDEVLKAPVEVIEGQMTIDEFEKERENQIVMTMVEEIVQATFVVTGTTRELLEVREFLRKGGYTYECK